MKWLHVLFDKFGWDYVPTACIIFGLLLALTTFNICTSGEKLNIKSLGKVIFNKSIFLIALFGGFMVGPLEGFADAWSASLMQEIFWSEVMNGLKPAKIAQKTQLDPPRRIPPQCYDTSDGFYNPKTLMLVSPTGELLRVPLCAEDLWIKKYCRKAYPDFANFRPDLFENWFNYDDKLIQSILDQQDLFRAGKISYRELQQFYADHELLLSNLTYKKRMSPSQIALEEFLRSFPHPKELKIRKKIKKYQGHDLLKYCIYADEHVMEVPVQEQHRISKSFHILDQEFEPKPKMSTSQAKIFSKGSKISFRIRQSDELELEKDHDLTSSSVKSYKKKIPERLLRHQPILRLKQPFSDKPKSVRQRPPCSSRDSNDDSDYWNIEPEGGSISLTSIMRKDLKRFMKKIIMDIVMKILLQERERHRKRYKWGKKLRPQPPSKKGKPKDECMEVLEELFMSIPEREEYSDSYPDKTANFLKFAEDKYNILKYWGNRMFTLNFPEDSPEDEIKSQAGQVFC